MQSFGSQPEGDNASDDLPKDDNKVRSLRE